MANSEMDSGATREDLLQRIELMETMIAEGRRFTTHYGWVFVLWGLVDLAAMGWRFFQPNSSWVMFWSWPICLVAGAVMTVVGLALQKRRSFSSNLKCRSLEAVWSMMGVALAIYIASTMVRHLTWQYSYVAALLVIVGLAHAISAVILKWRVQGAVAATWWVGAVAIFCVRSQTGLDIIMFVEMCLSMILFGLYAMMLERRDHA